MTLVELYSKDDCSLCDEARAVLQKVQRDLPFALREVKLSPGEERYEEYSELFPVIFVNKVFAFKHRINEATVKIRIQQAIKEEKHGGSVSQ